MYGLIKVFLLLGLLFSTTQAHNEIIKLLDNYDGGLSTAEIAALRPFYKELQVQYDYLLSLVLQNNDGSSDTLQAETNNNPELDAAYKQLQAEFSFYAEDKPSIVYDTKLPTLDELIDTTISNDLTLEQQLELLDMQSIMQDIIDEAQLSVDNMAKRALEIESVLFKLPIPKIVNGALYGLGIMWQYYGRFSRAAYCSYSHVPQMTEALHNVNGGVDCYKHTTGLIKSIEQETVYSIKTIRKNIFDLAAIYKKLAAKRTIVGKIVSGTLNLFRALRRVHDIIAVGIDAYDKINNELPAAAIKSAQCSTEFVNSIPQMIETTQNITTCIVFTDNDKPDYEFMKPESERYWNTGLNIPEL